MQLVFPKANTSDPMSDFMKNRFTQLGYLIGNTPMLEIEYSYRRQRGIMYVKCEHYNLTGSIKDRMALYTLYKAYRERKISPGDQIIEATSGNTGIAFASIGKALGHYVTIIMPSWLSKERIDIISSLGAEVILISKEDGGFLGSIELSRTMASKNKNCFLPCQFENSANAEAHELTTATEIWEQLSRHGVVPDAFVAGVGTGGTIMGVAKHLKGKVPYIKVHPLEPAESPTLSTGHKIGSHRIQGISDEFIPELLKLNELDKVIQVHDGDAILMAQKLATELGFAVGISSGANVVGAIKINAEMGMKGSIVTIFPDSNKKYLSTDLMKIEPSKPSYISTETQFVNYNPISRPK